MAAEKGPRGWVMMGIWPRGRPVSQEGPIVPFHRQRANQRYPQAVTWLCGKLQGLTHSSCLQGPETIWEDVMREGNPLIEDREAQEWQVHYSHLVTIY